jgi:pyruvate/2-oxoglutarate/acetoin dehydrogenase E1 component
MMANMAKALNMALHEEMARDERVVVLGEDVGRKGGPREGYRHAAQRGGHPRLRPRHGHGRS